MLWHGYQQHRRSCNAIAELADKMILTSKFCTSSRAGGKEDNIREVEVECKQDGVLGVDGVG